MTGKITNETTIAFRLTEPEKFIIQRLAAQEIISPGKLMRQIVREWLKTNGIDDPLRWIVDNELSGQYRENGNQDNLQNQQ